MGIHGEGAALQLCELTDDSGPEAARCLGNRLRPPDRLLVAELGTSARTAGPAGRAEAPPWGRGCTFLPLGFY